MGRCPTRRVECGGQTLTVSYRSAVDTSVLNEIFQYREYRAAEVVIRAARNPILDVGGHAGYFSLYCRALNPTVPIITVEPATENLVVMEENFTTNAVEPVEVVVGVLGAKTETRLFHLTRDSHTHSLLPPPLSERADSLPVQAYALGDLARERGIAGFGLVKLDVEGAEFELLPAWSPAEWALVQALVLEYHDTHEHHHQTLETLIREQGFRVQHFPSQFASHLGFLFAHRPQS